MARVSVALLAANTAVSLVGFGLVALDDRSGPPIVISDPRPDATIVVEVAGAVTKPGVYALSGDARTQDALVAAGGVLTDADLASINLAQRLRDEDHILVPRLVPTIAVSVVPPPPQGTDAPVSRSTTGEPAQTGMTVAASAPLDINAASAAELATLPEIGPVLAQRIVDYRTEHGPFRTVDELANVQGVSPRMVEAIRSLVAVGR